MSENAAQAAEILDLSTFYPLIKPLAGAHPVQAASRSVSRDETDQVPSFALHSIDAKYGVLFLVYALFLLSPYL